MHGKEAKEEKWNQYQEVKSRQAAEVGWRKKGLKDSCLEAAANEEVEELQDSKAR